MASRAKTEQQRKTRAVPASPLNLKWLVETDFFQKRMVPSESKTTPSRSKRRRLTETPPSAE